MNNEFKNTFNNNDGERQNRFLGMTLLKNSPVRQRPSHLFSSQNLK